MSVLGALKRRRCGACSLTCVPSDQEVNGLGEWTRIGDITLLQIQTGVLTETGSYDTSMLMQVDTLRLTRDGVLGRSGGEWLFDRHHRRHPAAKYWHAEDVLSFGFTSHYDHMWELFRPTPLGIAGENVIVVAEGMIDPASIEGGLRIETSGSPVDLDEPHPMEPCVEFTRFLTGRPGASAQEVKPDREKLRHGVRGFAVGIPELDQIEVTVGAAVLSRAN